MNAGVRIQAKPEAQPSTPPARANLLQRKCACGGTPDLTGECAACRSKRLLGLQRRPLDPAGPSAATRPDARDGLHSPGQFLDESAWSSIESRSGFDFSNIRVHSDARDIPTSPPGAISKAVESDRPYHGQRDRAGPVSLMPGPLAGSAEPSAGFRRFGRTSVGAEGTVEMPGEEEQTQAPDAGAPASGPPAPAAAPSGCRCCPVYMGIDHVSAFRRGKLYGHSFDVVIGLDYPPAGSKTPGDCELVWLEKTDRAPAWQGFRPNTWNDMFALFPGSPTFDGWTKNRRKLCPGRETAIITDPPAASVDLPARTLEFDLYVRGNGCGPTHGPGFYHALDNVKAKQVLEPDGTGGVKTQTFKVLESDGPEGRVVKTQTFSVGP